MNFELSSFRDVLRLVAIIGLVEFGIVAQGATNDAEGLFVHKVWPLLNEKCLACHGKDPEKIKGGLDLRTREAALKGGDSGEPTFVEGKPEKSWLYIASTWEDEDLQMPPKENDRLSSEQLTYLHEWIAGGAPWPDEKRRADIAHTVEDKWSSETGLIVETSGGLSEAWSNRKYEPENLWAYMPVVKPEVPKIGDAENPIDAFINHGLREREISPAPLAHRRMLIRRVTFNLIGLPPTPKEVADFIDDPADDETAFAKVVDRLLANPHYGEHQARHWMDVVRYADSSGFANDYERGTTWRYRDYVIRSFNEDKPYEEFIREQIAGDEMDPSDPEKLVATGFLRMGPWELTGMEVAKVARQRFLDDVTDSVGQVFLAHPMQCARCHDHKFDPVPTRDYYAMQAVFATTQLVDREAPFLEEENTAWFDEKRFLDQRKKRFQGILTELNQKEEISARAWAKERGLEYIPRNQGLKQGVPEDKLPPKKVGFSVEDYGAERIARKGRERLNWIYDRYKPIAFSVYNGVTPNMNSVNRPPRMPDNPMKDGELEKTAILAGGDPFSPTQQVKPGALSVVNAFIDGDVGLPELDIPDTVSGRRLALANWIAHRDNPLTTRTVVNRIWGWHFGTPIAGNPNNFGATGKKPTHPELLDWLAATFVEQDWSFKKLHRLILLSETYRRSSSHPHRETLSAKDPNGTSFAVFQPRRLTAEEFRDSMLRATGELNPTLGGIPARPEINLEAALQPRQVMGTFAEPWQPNPLPEQRHRRSIYALKIRGLRDPFMEVFNQPSPDLSCEVRDASTVTPQIFSLFNGKATYERAVALALRLKEETDTREGAVNRAFELTYGRTPSAQETKAAIDHWTQMTNRHRHMKLVKPEYPTEVIREAVEENTGEKFKFVEKLEFYVEFRPDPNLADVDVDTRGLAELCLVLFNSNEFAYVY